MFASFLKQNSHYLKNDPSYNKMYVYLYTYSTDKFKASDNINKTVIYYVMVSYEHL